MDAEGDKIRNLLPNRPVKDVQGGKKFVVRAKVGDTERSGRRGGAPPGRRYRTPTGPTT